MIYLVNPFNEFKSLNQIPPQSPFTKLEEIKHPKSNLITLVFYTWNLLGSQSAPATFLVFFRFVLSCQCM